MKLPVSISSHRQDRKNGGEYVVLKDADGAWIGDIRAEHIGALLRYLRPEGGERWILLSERKPPEGELVRVAGHHRLNVDAKHQDGRFWGWSEMHEDWAMDVGIVTHWMSLPTHPDEQSTPQEEKR